MSGPVTPIEDPDNHPDMPNPTIYIPSQEVQSTQRVNKVTSKDNISTEALSTEALLSAKNSLLNVLDTVMALEGTSSKENSKVPTTSTYDQVISNQTSKIVSSSVSSIAHPQAIDWEQQAQDAINVAETSFNDLKTTTDVDQMNLLLSKIIESNTTIQRAVENLGNSSIVEEASKKIAVILPEAQNLVQYVNISQTSLTQAKTSLTELNASTSISEIKSLLEKIQASASAAQQAAKESNNQPIAVQAAKEALAIAAQAAKDANAIQAAYDASMAAQQDLDKAQKTTSISIITKLLTDAQEQNEKAQQASAEVPNNTLAQQAAESTSLIVQQIQALLNAVNQIVNNVVSSSASQGNSSISSNERGTSQRISSLLSLSSSSQYTTLIEGLRRMLSVFEVNNPSLMDLSGVMKRIVTNTVNIRSNRSVKTEVNSFLSKIIEKITQTKNLSVKDKTSLTSIVLPALGSILGVNTLSVVHFNSIFTNITKFLSSLSLGTTTSANLIEFTQGIKNLNHLYPSLNKSGRSLVDSTMLDVLNTNLIPQDRLKAAIENKNFSSQKEMLVLASSLGGFLGVMNVLQQLNVVGSTMTLSGAQEKLLSSLQKIAGSPPPVYMAEPLDVSKSLVDKLSHQFVEGTKMSSEKQKQQFLLNSAFTHAFIFNLSSLIPRK